ncbi:hypothetical protein [Cellulosimicrobium sp. Marseille-Q4280]|uniref:hypothetical protein n=1 Tax=Cellulosimicrobium sp. Marseille-Q4280 TaxID=2937992 RepID=UPI00203FD771|nr:hypothetical protein [Cellulosimicrobium sp. Marseille-Q4280]
MTATTDHGNVDPRVAAALADIACPDCAAVGSLQLVWKLEPAPLGTYSLAGVQNKVSAARVPYLECACGFSERGKNT